MNISAMTDKEILQELMQRNNWTQRELAAQLGFKVHSQISNVVNEKGNLGSASRRLAELLLQQTEE